MLKPNGSAGKNGLDRTLDEPERGRRSEPLRSDMALPKNRSTGNLLAQGTKASDINKTNERARIRFSFDAQLGESETMSRSSGIPDHDHGLGTSGLRRIRQQPPPRAPTNPSSEASSRAPSVGPRSTSMSIPLPPQVRRTSAGGGLSTGPSSPNLGFGEDLTRFPSESLHSFSFAHQSDEFLHNRQNVLRKSIDFMRNRMGWHATNPGIASAQARINGDQDLQSMLELLARANIVTQDGISPMGLTLAYGPLTGPADFDNTNLFEKSFRTDSPEPMDDSPVLSPQNTRDLTPMRSPMTRSPNRLPEKLSPSSPPKSPEPSSRTPTNESESTAKTSPPITRRSSLKRTYTDTSPINMQNKLMEALSQPFNAQDPLMNEHLLSPTFPPPIGGPSQFGVAGNRPGPAVHGHSSRWSPAAQAIFTTETKAPWTILAANDLACLVFGVTKAEVRKMGIMEVVRPERRAWLEDKLKQPGSEAEWEARHSQSTRTTPTSTTSVLLGGGGITAQLLSKPSSRQAGGGRGRRAQTDDGAGSSLVARKKQNKSNSNHQANKSRGVLLCGDVVPIQKRNGAIGSASLWVKEKRGGLIWVLEEIHEDVTILSLDDEGELTKVTGSSGPIWGDNIAKAGLDIGALIPRIPRQGIDPRTGELDYAEIARSKYFTARNIGGSNIPISVERLLPTTDLKVSSFPHISGIMVLSAETLKITSSNSVFCSALFGQEQPDGLPVTALIPNFDRILKILTDEDGVRLEDGIVIPEHSFRRATAYLAIRDGKPDSSSSFLRPDGLPAKHRDGSEIRIDVQMRVVMSDKQVPATYDENVIEEASEGSSSEGSDDGHHEPPVIEPVSEVVYALWITYSRYLHAKSSVATTTSLIPRPETPMHQPSPGQTSDASPMDMDSDEPKKEVSHASLLTQQLAKESEKAAAKAASNGAIPDGKVKNAAPPAVDEPSHKKTIDDFIILEEMGQGAYGQVKLARYKKDNTKVVLKYVTKRRILVDTWTRDRRLGTVPLEIHVLDFLRREHMQHPNIVEMADFFEDSVNYYIEMLPHGLPGMDLFDYIELRVNMEENECKSIFIQVVRAVHHLHTKALVVHRDIKDENVVMDGDGKIKLIDFGSAAYIKNGPFDVFVGTIDYAAPEVLAGKPYRGKEQDVWALGILLYTIVYKENPFYSIDEIMDRDLRVPYIMSEDSIDLIRAMLNREVDQRISIEDVIAHPFFKDVE